MYKILKQLDITMLMRLRFALDKPELYHDIDQDIQDLYPYPERLNFTYPDEWRIFIRQQLMKRGISEHALHSWLSAEAENDALALEEDGNTTSTHDPSLPQPPLSEVQKLAALVVNSEPRYIDALAVLRQVQHIQSAPDVTALQPLRKRQLNKLLES